jgi:AcrR family transcriptional regulator
VVVVASAREQHLADVVEYVIANGVQDLSLRALATAIGTSHRMLLYHFGSKDQLLVEVVREIERQERSLVAASAPAEGADLDPAALLRGFWRRVSLPRYAARERLFFELYGRALQRRDATEELLDGIIDDWVEPSVALEIALGTEPAEARARARLCVAVVRGLLLDLLATGDRKGTTEAFELFVSTTYPASK